MRNIIDKNTLAHREEEGKHATDVEKYVEGFIDKLGEEKRIL